MSKGLFFLIQAAVMLVGGAVGAWLIWPTGISEKALGVVTFGELLRVLGSVAFAVVIFAVGAFLLVLARRD